jgi:hypothetical protein
MSASMKKLARHRMAAMAMVTLASPSAWSAPDNIDKQVAKDLQALIGLQPPLAMNRQKMGGCFQAHGPAV